MADEPDMDNRDPNELNSHVRVSMKCKIRFFVEFSSRKQSNSLENPKKDMF